MQHAPSDIVYILCIRNTCEGITTTERQTGEGTCYVSCKECFGNTAQTVCICIWVLHYYFLISLFSSLLLLCCFYLLYLSNRSFNIHCTLPGYLAPLPSRKKRVFRGWGIWSSCIGGGEFETCPQFHVRSPCYEASLSFAHLRKRFLKWKGLLRGRFWLRGQLAAVCNGLHKLCLEEVFIYYYYFFCYDSCIEYMDWIRCVYNCNTIDTSDQTYAMIWYAVAMNVCNVVIEVGGLFIELICRLKREEEMKKTKQKQKTNKKTVRTVWYDGEFCLY